MGHRLQIFVQVQKAATSDNMYAVTILCALAALCPYVVHAEPSCSQGWVSHGPMCYKLFKDYYPWEKANATCTSAGATQVRPRTNEDQQFIAKGLGVNWSGKGWWTDLTDHQDGPGYNWRFSDGSYPTDTQWHRYSPSGDYGCVLLAPEWINTPCSDTLNFICQRPAKE